MRLTILGIESSADETAGSLIRFEKGSFRVLSNVVASQVAIHAQYGGVVPEVAARNHIAAVMPVIKEAVGKKIPDVIAVTAGPGLITSLLVGVHTAKALSYLWGVPLVGVNHIEGHLYANFLKPELWQKRAQKIFPAVVLIVSGGHTELISMKGHGKYALLGATRDDAAGECYDKAASLLGLQYPGGPAIDQLSSEGDPSRFSLPRPMIENGNYEFSFSGLKTAVLYLTEKLKKEKKFNRQARADVAASFQQAVIDVLVAKTIAAARKTSAKTILLGGGVVANAHLRSRMQDAVHSSLPKTTFSYPDLKYCTDNAAMIAMAGYFHARKKEYTAWSTLDAMPQWELIR
ncbi:MAG: tRNA (adenosine(37)-N6)-threonylcarbamoyltransferase complex transferase subunit TsaD [Patescibacteria group bacterium]|mgnify:CR=1 FL=1